MMVMPAQLFEFFEGQPEAPGDHPQVPLTEIAGGVQRVDRGWRGKRRSRSVQAQRRAATLSEERRNWTA